MGRRNLWLIVGLGVLVLLGTLIYSSMNLRQHRVEVCMEFGGRNQCRVASGATRETALRTATENACTMIASGMTDSMACERSAPKSVRWLAGQ